MSRLFAGLLICFLLPAASRGQEAQLINTAPSAQLLPQPGFLDLNLMEALIAVDAAELAGIFSYIHELAGPSAFADYVLHSKKAMKKFLAKGTKDVKDTGGVNGWDRAVYMMILQINGSGMLPPGVDRLTPKQEQVLSGLVLERPLTLQEMTAARGSRR